jgi:hypothetical protein
MQAWQSPSAGERLDWDRAFESLLDSHLKKSVVCPSCESASLRLFFKRFDTGPRGGYWLWCPVCRRYEHGDGSVPGWWLDPIGVDLAALTPQPDWLEEHWANVQLEG